MESNINIKNLSPSERAELLNVLAEEQKKAKKLKKENREAYRDLTSQYVKKNIDKLINHNQKTEGLINELFEDYKTIKELKTMVYGDKNQDSHTSTLPDGSASITIGYNVSIGFDGTESSGVEKIKNFITSLVADDENTKKLTKMVNTFLKPNVKTGMLNPSKIIELNKLRGEFNDEGFNEGLDIIFDAQIRRQNSMFVSGFKHIEIDGKSKKIEFRFTI